LAPYIAGDATTLLPSPVATANRSLADDHLIASVAFPSVSTGAYGYPVDEAAAVAVRTIIDVLPNCTHVQHARFVLFDAATCRAYVQAAETISREPLAKPVIFEKTS
jgi:O-acetyl-ADP-ribose deacetylase (regulator of RNase III)